MLDSNKARSIIYNKLNKTLTIEFCDNYKADISAELLRVESPSAEVQGHSSKNKKTPLNKKNVAINQIERVGNYAIKIIFDDSHDTGIYSWAYLREMSENNIKLYEDYLNRVAKISAT
jgi:DUF971 family protein